MKRLGFALGGACAGLLALGGVAAAQPLQVTSPQVTASISGSAKGNPLSGEVSVQVESAKSVLIEIANTTPETSSTIPGAPVLTRLGFSLDGNPAGSCIQLEDPTGRFSLTKDVSDFCGVGGNKQGCGWKWGKKKKKKSQGFTHAINAKSPSVKKGIEQDETVTLRLKVHPSCSYSFSPGSFADAPFVGSGSSETQWAAQFQLVGKCGKHSGCGYGESEEVPDTCKPVYTWSEFIATSADLNQLPSAFKDPDSRAGSVEFNFNGGSGFNGVSNEAPYDAAILTLRSGEPSILEQWQFNRTLTPAVLDANGCSVGSAFSQCWIFNPEDSVAQVLSATVPTNVSSSNEGFDESGLRVEIAGGVDIAYSETVFEDNGHQKMLVEWHAPLGLETAQLLLRGRYDWDLNFLGSTDYFVPLLSRNIAALGPDFTHPSVDIVEETANTLRIVVDVQGATEAVCEDYLGAGLITLQGGPK
jgi:hypothetical protein